MEDQSKAKILKNTKENISICADKLKAGEVVSFATETVYGLGANCFIEDSVLNIFKFKGRPLSDPLILHVNTVDKIYPYVIVSDEEKTILEILAKNFWPGPLTLILKANTKYISSYITANTDFVSFRIPNSDIALELLSKLDFPVAAPSANKFCHVSPVTAEHVFSDFKNNDVTILDGGRCHYNMESTVVKIEFDCKKLLIFRKGAISLNELKDFQIKNLKDWDVEYKSKTTIEGENQDCPGQFIKHYSPNIPTYIVSKQISFTKNDVSVIKTDFLSNYSLNIKALNIENLNVIILDINGHLKNLLKDVDLKIEKYYDMTSDSVEKSKEALNNIYYYLRLTESSKANCVLLPFLDEILGDENNDKPTLFDRILKASSSMIIRFE